MTDYSELKRLADNYASLIDSEDRDSELEARDLFQDAARVDIVQSLIGRLEVSESMEGLYTSTVTVERAELEQTKRERNQLKVEIERLSKQLCICPSCHGQGEIFAGSHSYQGQWQPPEPDMDKCGECDGDGVIGTPVDLAAALAEIERLKGGQADAVIPASVDLERLKFGQGEPFGYWLYPKNLPLHGRFSKPDPEIQSAAVVEAFDITALFTSQPAPVSVVLPERKVLPRFDLHPMIYKEVEGWNACLDKVKELNK